MQAEFIRDNCDNVWFVYASKVQYRRCRNMNQIMGFKNDEEAEKQAQQFENQQTDLFTRELRDYQEALEAQRENFVMNRMRDYMSTYYDEMKKEMGINASLGEDEDHPHLDVVLDQIKPNRNPNNFAKFLRKKDNIGKDSRNKAIARKVQKKQDDEAFQETNLAKQF